MTDDTKTPSDASGDSQAPSGKKPRSPVERCIVWGMILVMGAVVAIEANARLGYEQSRVALQAAVAAADEDAEGDVLFNDFKKSDLKGIGVTSKTITDNGPIGSVVSLKWLSFFKRYELHVKITAGDEPAVLGMSTPGAAEGTPPPSSPLAPKADKAASE